MVFVVRAAGFFFSCKMTKVSADWMAGKRRTKGSGCGDVFGCTGISTIHGSSWLTAVFLTGI